MRPAPRDTDYRDYVAHPKYGREPRVTGLDPDWEDWRVVLRGAREFLTPAKRAEIKRLCGITVADYGQDATRVIKGTAIVARTDRQVPQTMQVTHYYDLDKVCRQCRRHFIFFAAEQQHWYETLRFKLEATAVHCPKCRQTMQAIGRRRKRYEALLQLKQRTVEQNLELAACSLALIEGGVFSPKQAQKVRMLLQRVPDALRTHPDYLDLRQRAQAVKAR